MSLRTEIVAQRSIILICITIILSVALALLSVWGQVFNFIALAMFGVFWFWKRINLYGILAIGFLIGFLVSMIILPAVYPLYGTEDLWASFLGGLLASG